MNSSPSIVVVGSLNIDTVLSVSQLPEPGATVSAWNTLSRYGGKGANQAIAACRQGASVSLIGCVGSDAGGTAYSAYLAEQGLAAALLFAHEELPTGRAYISVDGQGQNSIVVAGNANLQLTAEEVLSQYEVLDAADIILCQLESPVDAVVAALQRGTEAGRTTILNPSPMTGEFPWGAVPVEFLIVNETEAYALLGADVEDTQGAAQIRERMAELAVGNLIITRGAEPTLAFSAKQAFKIPPPPVEVVDTVGAGDTFAGAFAVHWAETQNLLISVRKANIAAALATTQLGAQEAIPYRDAVETFGQEPAESAE